MPHNERPPRAAEAHASAPAGCPNFLRFIANALVNARFAARVPTANAPIYGSNFRSAAIVFRCYRVRTCGVDRAIVIQETRSQVSVASCAKCNDAGIGPFSAQKEGLQTERANDDASNRGDATASCSGSRSLVDLQYNPGNLIRR
jgi:hypothetical protein